jgi:RND family efflux transporter MFP subunit
MNLLIKLLTRLILPLLVIGAGVAMAMYYVKHPPEAKRQPPPRRARLVEVTPVRFTDERVVVHAMGTVKPAREVALQPRVSGQIIKVSDEFAPGGQFTEGDVLVQIDPADFLLGVRQRESDLAQAKSALDLELGQQAVAKREFEMLGETVKTDERALVLRQPQLARAQAAVDTAQAALDLAKLHLERTTVRVPFNAMVRERHVNLGMQVTPATTLAMVTGTDAFWIEVAVPVDELQWIEVPRSNSKDGSRARVYNEAAWGAEAFREGRVIRLMGDLETEGRMARLLVEVPDPEAMMPGQKGKPRLLLDDYVRVEIDGIELKSVAALHREWVRDSDTVWVLGADNKLEIHPVRVMFRGRDRLYVRDSLRDGERIVTTDLAAPVHGMPLRTAEDVNKATQMPERPVTGDRAGGS